MEYAGYQSRKTVDWLSLAKGINEDVNQALKAREERKAADKKLSEDIRIKLGDWEKTEDKNFNQVMFNGLDNARNQVSSWYGDLKAGKITRAEYQQRVNNLNTSFDNFSTATKNYDEYLVSANEMLQSGEGSSAMAFSAGINSQMMNIKNKNIEIGQNGDFYIVDKSSSGGQPVNVRSLTDMNNIVHKKVDVASKVDAVVKNWDDITKQELKAGGRTVLETNPRLNESYKNATANLVNAIANPDNPKDIISILKDNSSLNYDMYFNDEEKNKLIDKAVATKEYVSGKKMTEEEKASFIADYEKNNLIQWQIQTDGTYQPVVTEKMMTDARQIVKDELEMQLGWKKEEERGFAPSGGGNDLDSSNKEYNKNADAYMRGYVASLKAFGMTPEGGTRGAKDFTGLSSKYRYKFENGFLKVYPLSDTRMEGEPIESLTSPDQLAYYVIGGSSKAAAATNYNKARAQYRRSKGLDGGSSVSGAGDAYFQKGG